MLIIKVVKKKFIIATTVSDSIPFFKGQIDVLKKDFDVRLLSSPGRHLDEMAELHQVPKYTVGMKREISFASDLLSLMNLVFLFLKVKPFIVHGNTPKAGLLSMFAAWLTRVPKRIYYVHGLRYHGEGGRKRGLLMMMEKLTCKFATHVIAVSEGVREVMKQDKIYRKQIYLIGNGSINGINTEYFNPKAVQHTVRESYGIRKDDFVFGFVGRLVRDKGINELVRAFEVISKEYQNSKLLLIGNLESNLDPVDPATLEAIESNPQIIYAGMQKDVRPFFGAMDIFVFPSYREGFGIVLIEAGAMKVPAIASDITGCNEIIQNKINGFLIPSRNETALLAKMKYCLNHKEEVRQMAAHSRKNVTDRFEQVKVWEQSYQLYKQIASS